MPTVIYPQPDTHLETGEEGRRRLGISKGHFSKLINGKVKGTPPLPVVRLGRRVLIREESFQLWLRELEAFGSRRSAR